jgi:hypothetical protein
LFVSDEPGIQLFAFHGNVNKEMDGLEAGQMARDIIKAKNGRWVFKDDRVKLKVGDVIYYWLYVQYEGLGYQKLDQSWTVTGEWPYFIKRKFTSQPITDVTAKEQTLFFNTSDSETAPGEAVIEALCYKPEGHGFETG